MSKLTFLSVVAVFLLASCGNDDESNPPESIGDVVVVNEGNFGQSNGSITLYDPDSETVSTNVFQSANNGLPLGDVVQSMFIDASEIGYVVVNNSRKIEAVDADFVSLSTIEDNLANPRYLVSANGRLFVSNWGNFDENFALDQSYVLILDAETFEKEGEVATDDGTENLIFTNGFVYASNNFANTVSVIDAGQGTLSATLDVGNSPGEMVVDNGGAIWLICGGSYQGNDGAIYKLSSAGAGRQVELEINPGTRLAIDKESGTLYFFAGTKIWSYNIEQGTLNKEWVTNDEVVGFYGIGFSASEGVIYAADAKGFQGRGTVYRYTPEGDLLSTFEAGVGPNAFLFR